MYPSPIDTRLQWIWPLRVWRMMKAKFNITLVRVIRTVTTSAISSQSCVKNTRWILPPPSCDNKHPQARIWLHLSLHPHAHIPPNVFCSIGVQLQPLLHDQKKRKWKKHNITALDSNFPPDSSGIHASSDWRWTAMLQCTISPWL